MTGDRSSELLLHLTEVSEEPLHGQISRQLRAKILAGDLDDGDSLPSIRGLAREQRVSVITVQRAYEDLDREGLIEAHRGKGFFVRALPEERKRTMAEGRFLEALRQLLGEARDEGLDAEQLRGLFERALAAQEDSHEG
jgi:GntR family transcriptional regulator